MKLWSVSWAWHRCGWVVLLLLGLKLGNAFGAVSQSRTVLREGPPTVEPVVVTATVAPTPLSQIPASVTVISREQIETQQAVSVTELLRRVPGLHIDQAGGRGSVSSVYLRGGDPSFTLVLIDGVKVNDPTNNRGGSFDFSTLSTDNIERIEIVRGPLSAVYGSDAMSGVINIITRQGETPSARDIEVAAGRFRYVRTLLQARGVQGVMDYALSISYLDQGEPVEGSEFKSTLVHANVGILLSDAMALRWVFRHTHIDSVAFPDASGGPRFAVLREVDDRDIEELTLGLNLEHELFPWWEYRLQLGMYDRQENVASPGVAPGVGNAFGIPASEINTSFRRYDLTLRHVFLVHQDARLALGAQGQFEAGRSDGSLAFVGPTDFDLSRNTYAPFFEVQLFLLPALLIQGGVRVDLPEGFRPEVSPRVSGAYTIVATNTTLRVNWGEGLKVPSFFALGDPIVGDPAIKPETSTSLDAGVTQSLWEQRVTVSATYFYTIFDDLIDFDTTTFRLVNRAEVTTQGVEMSWQVQPWPVLGVTAHLTYVDIDVKGGDAELRNRPQWRGGFTIQWRPVLRINVNLKVLLVGDVLDFSVPTDRRELDPYNRVDFAVTWTIASTWQLFFAIDNLFDTDYEEAVGFPAPGLRPHGGVRARF